MSLIGLLIMLGVILIFLGMFLAAMKFVIPFILIVIFLSLLKSLTE